MFPGLTGLKSNKPAVTSQGLGGDNTMVGPIATQKLGGNSLTQQMRSGQNWGMTQGAQTFGEGRDITGTGVQGFGTAGDTTGTAMGTTGQALQSLSPAEDYWTKLLSGDQHTMMQAISPYATQAATNYGNAMTQAQMGMPRGGYSSVLSAGLPQAQARDVNQQLYSLQPQAAQQLNTIAGTKNQIAGTQGNIAGIQGQIANWLSSLGIDVSKLGGSLFDSAMQSLMTGRGQDVSEHGQAMGMASQLANNFMNGISQGMSEANKAVYRS